MGYIRSIDVEGTLTIFLLVDPDGDKGISTFDSDKSGGRGRLWP